MYEIFHIVDLRRELKKIFTDGYEQKYQWCETDGPRHDQSPESSPWFKRIGDRAIGCTVYTHEYKDLIL